MVIILAINVLMPSPSSPGIALKFPMREKDEVQMLRTFCNFKHKVNSSLFYTSYLSVHVECTEAKFRSILKEYSDLFGVGLIISKGHASFKLQQPEYVADLKKGIAVNQLLSKFSKNDLRVRILDAGIKEHLLNDLDIIEQIRYTIRPYLSQENEYSVITIAKVLIRRGNNTITKAIQVQ